MNTHDCDLVVIGSGPGGYVAAIRASQLGLKTICVEKGNLGGVCLNWGCIPTKALLKSAEYMHFLNKHEEFGFSVSNIDVDFEKVVKRSRDVANRMSKGVGFLFKKNKVGQLKGFGYIKSSNEVEVRDNDGNTTDTIKCKNIIIATGARPRMFEGIEVDHKNIITSKEAMIQKKIPKSMIVMGAGAIGIEFAYFFNAFGTKITIIEMMDRILPIEDKDVSRELKRHFKKSGMKMLTNTRVLSAKSKDNAVEIEVEKKDGSKEIIIADIALNAIGIQANIEGIGIDEIGIDIDRGFIKTDAYMQTNIDGIYAIGDIAGPPWLAHKATAEGIVAAEHIAKHETIPIDYSNIPGCTYCQPQVASIGMTEEKALESGFEIKVGKCQFISSGKAHAIGEAKGFVKMIFDAKDGKVLGSHMIGPDVTEMIAEIGLARSAGATAKVLLKTIHAHPTLSEAVMEATAHAYNEAVNI